MSGGTARPAGLIVVGDDLGYCGELREALARQGLPAELWRGRLEELPAHALRRGTCGIYLVTCGTLEELALLCHDLRQASPASAVLALFRGPRSSYSVNRLLEAGVDDSMFLPCTVAELGAKLSLLLRWSGSVPAPGPTERRAGALCLFPELQAATLYGRSLELSRREFRLLLYFAEHPHVLFTREELRWHLAGELGHVTERQVSISLTSLRGKLGENCPYIRECGGKYYFLAK